MSAVLRIYATLVIAITLLQPASIWPVEQGEIELRLNGKTFTVQGLMATIENKNGKPMLYLGAADPMARTKINVVVALPNPLTGQQNFSSLHHDMLFTLKSPESTMLIMPQVQPVKSSLEMIETDSDDPEGYGAAMAARRTKPLHELSKEELNREQAISRQQRARSFRKREAEWAKMDLATRIRTGQGVMENPGQKNTAVFITVEPVFSGDTIVELKGSISGFAPGRQKKRWLLEASEFRAIFINQ